MCLNLFETKTLEKVCIYGVCLIPSSLLCLHLQQGSRWVGYLGNKASKRIPLGTGGLINFLSGRGSWAIVLFHPQDLDDGVRAVLIMWYRISRNSLEVW